MSNSQNIVLFIGAGFSMEAGLPTIGEFGTLAKEEYNNLKSQHYDVDKTSGQYRHSSPMLIEAAEVFMKFQSLCQNSETLNNADIDNLETVFCIAEILKESNIENVILDGNEYSIFEILDHIRIWLWKIYHMCPLVDDGKVEAEKEYNDFFNFLKERNIYRNLNVITTNYDLIFEYMTWKNGVRCIYPIMNNYEKSISLVDPQGAPSKHYYVQSHQYSYDETSQALTRHCEDINAPVLYKLHGSINYFTNDEDNECSLMISDDVMNLGDKIGNSGTSKSKPAILAVDAIWDIRNKYGRSVVPMIIPPTYSKLTGYAWLRQIWNEAITALSKADKIIFIGYSMPESDGFMRAMVHGAMALRKGQSVPQVYVIDPNVETYVKYHALFKGVIQNNQSLTFSESVKNGYIFEIIND